MKYIKITEKEFLEIKMNECFGWALSGMLLSQIFLFFSFFSTNFLIPFSILFLGALYLFIEGSKYAFKLIKLKRERK